MHIVYLIQLNRSEIPNKYIGSKTNCRVINGKIVGLLDDNEYVGSSKDSTYKELIKIHGYTLHVLGTFNSYAEVISAERDAHIASDVVISAEFFNRSIATVNTYADPQYATMRHIETGKVARIPKNHPKILSGEWVGVTKGVRFTDEEKKKRGLPGELNPFFGKHHTEATKRILSQLAKRTFTGKPKSYEQRRKMAEARKLWWINHRKNRTSGQTKGV